ncbi:hypothetical protein JCM15519_36760 [Fundidesulfovibrio butyratiphilus]
MYPETGPKTVVEMIRQTAKTIRELEAQANRALLQQGDKITHRNNLLEKCELLMDLRDRAVPLVENNDPLSRRIRDGLEGFAKRANMAMNVDSIFFMGALLYPEDYEDGQPNDLERFLQSIESA